MKNFLIFDLDGTLCDHSHRLAFARSGEWDDYNSRCVEDPVIVPIADLLMEMSQFYAIIILTGRQEKWRGQTVKWLEDAGLDGHYSELLMRANDDFSFNGTMKIKMLEQRFGDKEGALKNIKWIIDDNDQDIETFRNYGLFVIQTFEGGY